MGLVRRAVEAPTRPMLHCVLLCAYLPTLPTCGVARRRRMSQRVHYTFLVRPPSGFPRPRSVDGGIFGAKTREEHIVGSAEVAYVTPESRIGGIWPRKSCGGYPRFLPRT